MDYKKLFWHRMWLALFVLVTWSLIPFIGDLGLLLAFIVIGALAGTFFKTFAIEKAKNWRWFAVQAAIFVLAELAIFLILPFTIGALKKGQEADFLTIANTSIFYALLLLIIFTLGRSGAEIYRRFAIRSFAK